jgi:hypothetical protein
VEQVASRYAGVEVKKVDVTIEPARFAELRVISTPAIAVAGKLQFVGVPREAALVAKIEAACGSS